MAGYNYFMEAAKRNLLQLMGITNPTPEQSDMAEKVVYNIERYTASKA